MHRIRRLSTVIREVLTGLLLVVLFLLFMPRTRHPDNPFGDVNRRQPGSARAEAGHDITREARLKDLRTLPAYQVVKQSLKDLEVARAALLKTASAADGDAVIAASSGYQESVHRVRNDLATLRAYLDSAEFDACWRDLFGLRSAPGAAAPIVLESRLGILSREHSR